MTVMKVSVRSNMLTRNPQSENTNSQIDKHNFKYRSIYFLKDYDSDTFVTLNLFLFVYVFIEPDVTFYRYILLVFAPITTLKNLNPAKTLEVSYQILIRK